MGTPSALFRPDGARFTRQGAYLLAAAFFLCAPVLEAAPAETRQFSSANKAYLLNITAAALRGRTKSFFELNDARGNKISSFKTDCYAVQVSVSDNGRSLAAQCGWAGRQVVINEIVFFNSGGKVLARHNLSLTGNGGQAFSSDSSVFAYAYQRGPVSALCMFDTKTGRKLWERSFEARFGGFKLAAGGGRLLVLTAAARTYSAFLFDASGKELWRADLVTGNSCKPEYINAAGSRFAVTETTQVDIGETGYVRSVPTRRHHYIYKDGKVTEEPVEILETGTANLNPAVH